MIRHIIAVLLIYFHLSCSSNKKQARFEVYLENVHPCKNPNPPYGKKVTIIPKYTINVVKGKRYLSGNNTVLVNTPFLNFSARTYSVDNAGQRVMKYQISQVTCKNIVARTILLFFNASISTKNCVLRKGFYSYENMDADKISHALPGWHSPGTAIHVMHLVSRGATDLCNEVTVQIRDPNKIKQNN